MKDCLKQFLLYFFLTFTTVSSLYSQSEYSTDIPGLIHGETCIANAPTTQNYYTDIPQPNGCTLFSIEWYYTGSGSISPSSTNTYMSDWATLNYQGKEGGEVRVVLYYHSSDPNAPYSLFTFTSSLAITSPQPELWFPFIKTQTERTVYNYQQVPDILVEYGPYTPQSSSCAIFSWQWQSSNSPIDNFVDIIGATGTSYAFSTPLNQTTYFRRKITDQTGYYVYSNVLKIEVVSLNWEDRNYTRVHDILLSGIKDWQTVDQLSIGKKLVATRYFDGLGRTTEEISKETATPVTANDPWGDVVNLTSYNGLGIPSNFLPYTTTNQSGNFKTDALNELWTYYQTSYNAINPSTQFTYENSPLNRIINVYKPGEAWWLNTPTKFEYDINNADENVQQLTVDFIAGSMPQKLTPYTANQLFRNVTIDENSKKLIMRIKS